MTINLYNSWINGHYYKNITARLYIVLLVFYYFVYVYNAHKKLYNIYMYTIRLYRVIVILRYFNFIENNIQEIRTLLVFKF